MAIQQRTGFSEKREQIFTHLRSARRWRAVFGGPPKTLASHAMYLVIEEKNAVLNSVAGLFDELSNGVPSGVRSPDGETSYPEVSYAACPASSTRAITSISTFAPLGRPETWTVERAGGFCLK